MSGLWVPFPALYDVYKKTDAEILIPAFMLLVLAVMAGNYCTIVSKYLFRQMCFRFFPRLLLSPLVNLLTQSGWTPPDGAGVPKQR